MAHRTTVLALSPSTGGPYFGEVLTGLTRELTAVGGRVVLVQTLGPGERAGELVEPPSFSTPVAWGEIDGAVAITAAVGAPYLQRLRNAGKPVVIASARIDGFDAPLALPDNDAGTTAAVEHLIAHGHTRIGFVTIPNSSDVDDRLAAYRRTLRAHGLPADPGLVFTAARNSASGGAEAAFAVLATPWAPTALMVATDLVAIGLMRTLADAGLAIPRDVAIVSFDNIAPAAFTSPPLSSVHQRFDEVGAMAGRLLLAQLRGEPVEFATHIVASAGIALRGSCGCGPEPSVGLVTPTEPADGGAAPTVRAELVALLEGALLTTGSAAGGPTSDAVLAIAVEVDLLLAGGLDGGTDGGPDCGPDGEVAPPGRVAALVASLREIAPDRNVLHRTVGALTDYLQRTGPGPTVSPGGPTSIASEQVVAALW